jgi:hypothetical protein
MGRAGKNTTDGQADIPPAPVDLTALWVDEFIALCSTPPTDTAQLTEHLRRLDELEALGA